jgi:hypothetical protein
MLQILFLDFLTNIFSMRWLGPSKKFLSFSSKTQLNIFQICKVQIILDNILPELKFWRLKYFLKIRFLNLVSTEDATFI